MTWRKFIMYILLCIVTVLAVWLIAYILIDVNTHNVIKQDNIDFNYNKSEIDSLYKNIFKTDSLIKDFKRLDSIKYEEIWNLDDSSSVELFYKLSKGR